MAVLCAPVALFVTVIDAPGIRAPLSSRTTPTILPVVSSCARKAMPVVNRVRTTAREILVHRFMFPPFSILGVRARFSRTLGLPCLRLKQKNFGRRGFHHAECRTEVYR